MLWNLTFEHVNERSIVIWHSVPVEHLATAISGADIVWSCLVAEEAVSEIFDTVIPERSNEAHLEGVRDWCKFVVMAGRETLRPGRSRSLMPTIRGANFFGEPSMGPTGSIACALVRVNEAAAMILPFVEGV